ncbi:MAG: bifunctional precorrin-2 dehydrogenase/sirohydrochlorin ferrochelatase [Clostridiales bacterium]|nr:bifunctional precorrin-2 dehydrogenase/sirohydrochlorin ferrochelatase [Clostridiales bacterium]
MAWFPMFVDLQDAPCLVVGGGKVALRKAKLLLDFGAAVRVVAVNVLPELSGLPLEIRERAVCVSDIDGMCLVVDATGRKEVGMMLAEACRKARVPLNVVDEKSLCSFIFPAMHRDGDLTLAVSTGGTSPLAAAWVRDRAKEQIPEHFDEMLEQMEQLRTQAKARISSQPDRKAFLARCLSAMLEKGDTLSEEERNQLLSK